VGRLRRLAELKGEPSVEPAVAVVVDEDFEQAAVELRDAGERGWAIAAAVVRRDDAVLIGNRFDTAIPIVDEVDDAAALPAGMLAAVEVAQPGASVEQVSDPLRLAVLLGLDPVEARAARYAARAVAGHRAAIVVRGPSLPAAASGEEAAPITLQYADGTEVPLDEHAAPPRPGAVSALRGAAGDHRGLLDVTWCRLPSPPDDAGFARRLARRRAVALALLARGTDGDLMAQLESLAPAGVRVVCRESEAAVLGASTTPGAGEAPFVLDLGGGTVDLHRELGPAEQAVSAAGAGDLVTRICAGLLGCDIALAERAKRSRSVRVETPFVVHHEDGSRSFLG
jgi:hypothetical protein